MKFPKFKTEKKTTKKARSFVANPEDLLMMLVNGNRSTMRSAKDFTEVKKQSLRSFMFAVSIDLLYRYSEHMKSVEALFFKKPPKR